MTEPILIDGSRGEGGGQVLRTAVGLAAALGKAVRVVNVRAGRPRPGLQAQHLAAVRAAARVCDGRLQGDRIGSTELAFEPGPPRAGEYRFDIGTAGSTGLVLQTVLPALLLAEGTSQVAVTGGTHNPWAPCFEYLRDVFSALASAANINLHLELLRAGFYPAGGGEVRMHVQGLGSAENLRPLRLLSRGELHRIEGLSLASTSLPPHVVERQATRAASALEAAGHRAAIARTTRETLSPGTAVFLRAVFSRTVAGTSALGARGKPAETVADEAVRELRDFLEGDGAVDPHAADQLLTLAALCPSESVLAASRLTRHLATNAEVIRLLTGRTVLLDGREGEPGTVRLLAAETEKA